MSQNNEISIEFTAAEAALLDGAIAQIQQVLVGKIINLSAKDRQAYASLGDETENWAVKARAYMAAHPTWVDTDIINLFEHDKDIAARNVINPRMNAIKAIYEGLSDTSLLLGFDIYNDGLAFYNIAKLKAASNVVGAKTVVDDLKTQFKRRRTLPTEPDGNTPPPSPTPPPAQTPPPPAGPNAGN